ncbi:Co/Zn/Cd cation transporter [Flavobacterium suaedae]|uniref:Co/Zn/Cd cation transporter n=1 Tax=Flavobacterium suaedae TaxID=1767027 RepID=A0ABQ1JSQ5_9FLAO|nr:cation diffusion facilitator family transporter [Flavobacterium suaedae]GGB76288.1 Co/Zn/Cd cation transporter [Flavobacterium suaedae]
MEIKQFELPKHLQPELNRAKRLEYITILYQLSVVILMYLVMGSSQAMKTAWLEDALGIVPSISFLIALKISDKGPDHKFQYGYHKVFSIAYLTGSIALFGMGCFLIVDSIISLINTEHPSIGSIMLFGQQIWMGWIMIGVLIYSAIPAMILGFKKLPIAKKLHNKILYTDAAAQKADYMTAFAAIVGIIGIGAGLWWADACAAIIISGSVLKDGYTNLKTAILDLMDRRPVHIDSSGEDELIAKVEEYVKSWEWVKDAKSRFREHGQVYYGEIFIVADGNYPLPQYTENSLHDLKNFHWKLHDVVITIVKQLPEWK